MQISNLSTLKILIIYAHEGSMDEMRRAILHHLRVLEASDVKHDIVYYNALEDATFGSVPFNDLSSGIPAQFANIPFDVVILHTTFLCYRWTGWNFYRWKQQFQWIGEMNCLKVALPQDEYDHTEILNEWMLDWGVNVIFSTFDVHDRKLLYPLLDKKVDFYKCLTGYINESTAEQIKVKLLPTEMRPYQIIYRASHLPYWFGSQGQLKHRIADIVSERALAHGMKINISTRLEDRILGDQWFDFLSSGQTVIGCESGSSVIDWRGEIQTRIRALIREKQDLSFTDVSFKMPAGWDDYKLVAISPRHFEAIITKTCQVLVEGNYDGILKPNTHYIPLRRDFSNLDEVLEKIKDHRYTQKIAEQAYQDIYLNGNYTYRAFACLIEKALLEHRHKIDPHPERQSMNQTDQYDAVEALERQLVSERHNNALLHAKLLEAGFARNEMQLPQNKKRILWILTGLLVILSNAIITSIILFLLLSLFGTR